MKLKTIVFAILISKSFSVFSQSNKLIIAKGIKLPKDTMIKNQLLFSLNGFLSQKEKPNNENTFVLKDELLSTSVLLDEIKEIETNYELKDSVFYKSYLTNVSKINDNDFLVQFSYIGSSGDQPSLRASFKLLAIKKDNTFYFVSPLKQNTDHWKSIRLGNIVFHYKKTLDSARASAYQQKINEYDTKLKAPNYPVEFYCSDNCQDALQIIGVDYKSDYNGRSRLTLSSHENKNTLIVDGSLNSNLINFDPHDLWHERLNNILPKEVINHSVDEGCAYLYGGSWGLSWVQIFNKLSAYSALNTHADWFALYNKNEHFENKGEAPLNIDFAINAMFIQKIEKEKGFPGVIDLLSSGNSKGVNDNYYKVLEKLTGINKKNFNKQVELLINKGA